MIVVDTNVIAYLAIPSPYTERAEQLFLEDPEWAAPQLWQSEMRNVLALYLRKGLLDFDRAIQVQAEMEDLLRDHTYQVNSLDILYWVNNSNCSAYDCEFVALAKSFGSKLVTMDKKQVREFPQTAVLLTEY